MCNLYSMTKGQAAILAMARAMVDRTGNLAPHDRIYPDGAAPIVRNEGKDRVLALARWGMPSPAFALKGKPDKNGVSKTKADRGVTNIRNVASPHWRRWLGTDNRCLVPLTMFCEHKVMPDGTRPQVWFALDEDRPLAFFAGIWVPQWKSVRKIKDGETTDDLFAFLTTEPNAEVAAVHPKAMPVILTKPDELDLWMNADWPSAAAMQRPLADGALKIVSSGLTEGKIWNTKT